MSVNVFYVGLGYIALFIFGSLGLSIWRFRRRGTRGPLPQGFKLLRGPGESLRKKMADYDENLLFRLLVASLVPLGAVLVVGKAIILAEPHVGGPIWMWYGIWAVAFLAALIPTVRWVLRDLQIYRNCRLGYLGERAVGEQLTPLIAQGYAVFHDVPGKGEKKPFNLDHVTVGPTGVAVIETKTRRKGRVRPGFKDHEVAYDGRQLIWPWGEDRNGLDQALGEAEWLRRWIRERTGIDTPVKAILALPGWWVEQKARGPVTVVNHKQVPEAVRGDKVRTLGAEQIDLIARQLDTLCRDVED